MTRTKALAASFVALLAGVVSSPAHAQSAVDGFNPGANFTVSAIALQPDGKIVVGGVFTTLGGGGTGTTARSYLGRLHHDGSLDLTFNPGATGPIQALVVQPDGKILVGGLFTMLGGGGGGLTPRNFIGRLHADGSLDTTFDPGANDIVDALALQPDGKILVGGRFRMLGGGGTGTTTRNGIGRLHPDGSLDTTFNPDAIGALTSAGVSSLVLQPDGKILVGGWFESQGGAGAATSVGSIPEARSTRPSIQVQTVQSSRWRSSQMARSSSEVSSRPWVGEGRARRCALGSDGFILTARSTRTFDPGANEVVRAVAVQPDGKTLVGGQFTALGNGGTGSATRKRIGRLHPDGSLDADFNLGSTTPRSPDSPAHSGALSSLRRCSPTAKSCLAARSRHWVAAPARRRAISSVVFTPTAPSMRI